jgi:hypothetical protein
MTRKKNGFPEQERGRRRLVGYQHAYVDSETHTHARVTVLYDTDMLMRTDSGAFCYNRVEREYRLGPVDVIGLLKIRQAVDEQIQAAMGGTEHSFKIEADDLIRKSIKADLTKEETQRLKFLKKNLGDFYHALTTAEAKKQVLQSTETWLGEDEHES